MADLTLNVAVKRGTTVTSVRGRADASRCLLLRDGVHVARTLRRYGPIAVDVAGVDRLAAVVRLALRHFGREWSTILAACGNNARYATGRTLRRLP